MDPNVPTGSSSEIVRQYFDRLYGHYLSGTGQTYFIDWDVVLWFIFYTLILLALFFFYTRWQRYTRTKGDPHAVESYNGYIQETNGPVGRFLSLFFVLMLIWLVIVTLMNLTNGQVY